MLETFEPRTLRPDLPCKVDSRVQRGTHPQHHEFNLLAIGDE
jgi:hypothetical protein